MSSKVQEEEKQAGLLKSADTFIKFTFGRLETQRDVRVKGGVSFRLCCFRLCSLEFCPHCGF